MPLLTLPSIELQDSFLEALREYHLEGRHLHLSVTLLSYPENFRSWVRLLREEAEREDLLPERAPQTTLWWVEGGTYLGRLSLRHLLTPWLCEVGGHIGYEVRPSARRQGHATSMLQAALPVARSMGIDPALLTCDTDNYPSRRVIEAAGGLLEDERSGKLRFWVPTSS